MATRLNRAASFTLIRPEIRLSKSQNTRNAENDLLDAKFELSNFPGGNIILVTGFLARVAAAEAELAEAQAADRAAARANKKASYFADGSNQITVRNLRLQFSIEKHLGKEPNTCTVTVTNLAESSRSELQELPLKVVLEAGYQDQIETLFTGDVIFAESKREGVEWNTTFQLGDGLRAYKYARLTKSYKKGVKVRTVLKDVADSMGLKLPENIESNRELDKQFAAGRSVDGFARDQLTDLLDTANLSWSMQNGQLQILQGNEARRTKGDIVISQENGMIGVPELATPTEKGKRPTLTVNSLLRADILPGQSIVLQTISHRGRYKVKRVVHNGDTHGDTWTTEIEASPL